MAFYRLPDQPFGDYDIIFAHDYGSLEDNTLPDPTIQVLNRTIEVARKCQSSSILWSTANYFDQSDPGLVRQLDKAKLAIIQNELKEGRVVNLGGAKNTITEVKQVSAWCDSQGLKDLRIVVVCEQAHARRCQIIWHKIFPNSQIFIQSVVGRWDENHKGFFGKSYLRYLIPSFGHHVFLRIVPFDWIEKIRYPDF